MNTNNNTNNINNIKLGDIVLAEYLTFTKEIKIGIFLVYAIDHTLDGNVRTFSTFKLSTTPRSFQLKLDASYYRFLNHDSYINANSTQRLCVDQIQAVLGTANSHTMSLIKKQLKNYMRQVYDELDESIEKGLKATICYSTNPNNQSLHQNDTIVTINGKEVPLTKLMSLINQSIQES